MRQVLRRGKDLILTDKTDELDPDRFSVEIKSLIQNRHLKQAFTRAECGPGSDVDHGIQGAMILNGLSGIDDIRWDYPSRRKAQIGGRPAEFSPAVGTRNDCPFDAVRTPEKADGLA